jgi:hypothetical protein
MSLAGGVVAQVVLADTPFQMPKFYLERPVAGFQKSQIEETVEILKTIERPLVLKSLFRFMDWDADHGCQGWETFLAEDFTRLAITEFPYYDPRDKDDPLTEWEPLNERAKERGMKFLPYETSDRGTWVTDDLPGLMVGYSYEPKGGSVGAAPVLEICYGDSVECSPETITSYQVDLRLSLPKPLFTDDQEAKLRKDTQSRVVLWGADTRYYKPDRQESYDSHPARFQPLNVLPAKDGSVRVVYFSPLVRYSTEHPRNDELAFSVWKLATSHDAELICQFVVESQ